MVSSKGLLFLLIISLGFVQISAITFKGTKDKVLDQAEERKMVHAAITTQKMKQTETTTQKLQQERKQESDSSSSSVSSSTKSSDEYDKIEERNQDYVMASDISGPFHRRSAKRELNVRAPTSFIARTHTDDDDDDDNSSASGSLIVDSKLFMFIVSVSALFFGLVQ